MPCCARPGSKKAMPFWKKEKPPKKRCFSFRKSRGDPSSAHGAFARFSCEKPSLWAPASPLSHKTHCVGVLWEPWEIHISKRDVSSNARLCREEKHYTNSRGRRRGDPMWSPGSVTLDPSSSHGQICSLRGSAAKIHFMAGVSSFPQNKAEP